MQNNFRQSLLDQKPKPQRVHPPRLVATVTERPAFFEEGGIRHNSKHFTNFGYAKLICEKDAKPKTPVSVFPMISYKGRKMHMKSMLFYVKKSDLIVIVTWSSPDSLKKERRVCKDKHF
jgi:hypothetical protein